MRADARRICKYLESIGFFGIEYVEDFKHNEWRVQAFNRCGVRRVYNSLGEARYDNRQDVYVKEMMS